MVNEERSDEVGSKISRIVTIRLPAILSPFSIPQFWLAQFQNHIMVAKKRHFLIWVKAALLLEEVALRQVKECRILFEYVVDRIRS
jgi:hypothetical protein